MFAYLFRSAFFAWLAFLMTFICITSVLANENKDTDQAAGGSIEAVINAWQNREKKTRTFTFEWTGQHFQSGGFSEFISNGRISRHGSSSAPDKTLRINRRFEEDESGRYRIDDDAPLGCLRRRILLG